MSNEELDVDTILDDIVSRFLINLPDSELAFPRIFFTLEEAWWFYDDFYCDKYNYLPRYRLRSFALEMFNHCTFLEPYMDNFDKLFKEFRKYVNEVPVCGAILLNEKLNKMLMVKSWSGSSWSFPKGKINKNEDLMTCATREVKEEIGFDCKGLIKRDNYIHVKVKGSKKQLRLYVVPGVDEGTKFQTTTRKEIGGIKWFKLNSDDNSPKYANGIKPILQRLKRWVKKNKDSWKNKSQSPKQSKKKRRKNNASKSPKQSQKLQKGSSPKSPVQSYKKLQNGTSQNGKSPMQSFKKSPHQSYQRSPHQSFKKSPHQSYQRSPQQSFKKGKSPILGYRNSPQQGYRKDRKRNGRRQKYDQWNDATFDNQQYFSPEEMFKVNAKIRKKEMSSDDDYKRTPKKKSIPVDMGSLFSLDVNNSNNNVNSVNVNMNNMKNMNNVNMNNMKNMNNVNTKNMNSVNMNNVNMNNMKNVNNMNNVNNNMNNMNNRSIFKNINQQKPMPYNNGKFIPTMYDPAYNNMSMQHPMQRVGYPTRILKHNPLLNFQFNIEQIMEPFRQLRQQLAQQN